MHLHKVFWKTDGKLTSTYIITADETVTLPDVIRARDTYIATHTDPLGMIDRAVYLGELIDVRPVLPEAPPKPWTAGGESFRRMMKMADEFNAFIRAITKPATGTTEHMRGAETPKEPDDKAERAFRRYGEMMLERQKLNARPLTLTIEASSDATDMFCGDCIFREADLHYYCRLFRCDNLTDVKTPDDSVETLRLQQCIQHERDRKTVRDADQRPTPPEKFQKSPPRGGVMLCGSEEEK